MKRKAYDKDLVALQEILNKEKAEYGKELKAVLADLLLRYYNGAKIITDNDILESPEITKTSVCLYSRNKEKNIDMESIKPEYQKDVIQQVWNTMNTEIWKDKLNAI